MLTKEAKRQCLFEIRKLTDALSNNHVADDKRISCLKRIRDLRLVIKEMDKLERECER